MCNKPCLTNTYVQSDMLVKHRAVTETTEQLYELNSPRLFFFLAKNSPNYEAPTWSWLIPDTTGWSLAVRLCEKRRQVRFGRSSAVRWAASGPDAEEVFLEACSRQAGWSPEESTAHTQRENNKSRLTARSTAAACRGAEQGSVSSCIFNEG